MAELGYDASYAEEKKSETAASFHVSHRRFDSVQDYVGALGGSRGRVIEKVLIANNGVAAVKAIRSIRKWAYDIFGDEKAIQFVVMATPEDLRANAEYIRMGDVIVDVPGGSNNHNYANVTLIVELARLHGAHAVWAGWGHASENPTLPDTLAKSDPPIKFIGPSGPPMRALGDKIGSTIIAQTAGVPCIAWNGDEVRAEYDRQTGCLPSAAYAAATITNAAEALESAIKIGFPIMIKASEGGGGKGIRMVDCADNVQTAYRQVCGEVPGSPIFIMKLSSKSRHLEVQLLADEYGDAVALNGRDCSVQRRHQKIIEEGPPVAAPPDIWNEMEKAAVALAKAVGYANAGTVEYLYSEPDKKFYFLELNPRLQVEHPVTEMITHVNLPAAQLQVAMGIPLHNIPDIRELYGAGRFSEGESPDDSSSKIDFASAERERPFGHCIAVRITAENAEAGFKPTSGGIQELNFRSTPNVWGYFSMDSSGSIHEFADSQFGHLFASGTDREQARRNMVLALKELSIRGDISTTIDYISNLIELDDFIGNRIDTGWLDALIKENADSGASASEASEAMFRRRSSVRTKKLSNDTYAVIGAVILAYDRCSCDEAEYLEALDKGQLPPQSLLKVVHDIELILSGVKYKLRCSRTGSNTFNISVSGVDDMSVEASVRALSDGGNLIDIGGKSHVAYLTSKGDAASGMRMSIDGANIAFSPDYDPTSLRTDVAGKLVKKLIPDGSHAKKGEPYGEIEVMKMFMPLKVEEAGIITWCVNEGAALAPGDLLASLELDNPDNVSTATIFEGHLAVHGWGGTSAASDGAAAPTSSHLLLRKALARIQGGMNGYLLSSTGLKQAMDMLQNTATASLLPVYEIEEQLSVLSGRIDAKLYQQLSSLLSEFKERDGNGVHMRFPAEKVVELISQQADAIASSDQAAFVALTKPLLDTTAPYTKSQASGVPGAERVLLSFLEILRGWVSTERWFCDGVSYADAVDTLRKANKGNFQEVLAICRAHSQLESTSMIVTSLIEAIGDGMRLDSATSASSPIGKRVSAVAGAESLSEVIPCLSDIGSMGGNTHYVAVALKARKLILQESLPSIEQRKARALELASTMVSTSGDQKEVQEFINENVPVADILFPMLKDSDPEGEMALLEMYARKLYRTHVLKDVDRNPDSRTVKFSFVSKQSERVFSASTPVTSMTELTRVMSRQGSLSALASSVPQSPSERNLLSVSRGDDMAPPLTKRTGVIKLFDSLTDVEDSLSGALEAFPQFTGAAENCSTGPINVLYIVIMGDGESNADDLSSKCEDLLRPYRTGLENADLRRVSFIFNSHGKSDGHQYLMPTLLTYRSQLDFKEDSLFRGIEPSFAYHLDLTRLAKNFSVRSLDSRQMSTGHVHLYTATPRPQALAKEKKANKAPRIFARALSFVLDFSSTSFERILIDALNVLDINASGGAQGSDNHLFINLVSDYERVVLDPVVVEQIVVSILKRHSERVARLGIAEVETRLVCCLSEDCPPIALRMVASNPTGYVHVMNTYVEAAEEGGGDAVFRLIGGTKASLACSGDSSWEGMKVTSSYPLVRPFDAQRKAALRSSDTLYCYDLPALFEAAVENQWSEASAKGGIEGNIRAASRPLMVMYTTELVVQRKRGEGAWTMEDYLNGDLELAQVQRGAGSNNVGMVAWLMELKTVEYPNGRQVVLIANDITHKAGSFGTREDVVFKLASEFARDKRIPRLYVAANSGARIGLADRIKKVYKVAFKDQSKPENGFHYLYVSKEDYELLSAEEELCAEPVVLNGEEVYKITDIIGSEPDLGVENLKGSGLIAGETSSAYNDIFTMTIVLGRTVGIGAYLVRLGQRTIQKTTASPIILTGYQALNKLMGCDVYSTNDQLGGPGIMYSNGVSHLAEPDHLSAVIAAVNWLSFVPSARGSLLPITDIRGLDEIERPIEFCPSPSTPYDPRLLLTGCDNEDGSWMSGFFDKGSFRETLSGWAKTVVVGRARLGGIPMGVIATENRTSEAIKPADPADVKASEAIIQEAGCVWFPNSAYKTAQAINDFRTEDLPLIVFANWRGFSGGQRDMFDEVLKYGSLIVDAFVAYKQPVFVFIPPFAEVRGGAWVVLDASINASVMEMYACKGSARGGVLEANGAASVKYRVKDLIPTMHRLDDEIKSLDQQLQAATETGKDVSSIKEAINNREKALLPVYEQIAVQFCDLHDTPGRMKAVGVIEKDVEWRDSRTFFFWRLRRKLAEFDLRKKVMEAAEVGRGITKITPMEASAIVKTWLVETPGMTEGMWKDDKAMLSWMANNNERLEEKVLQLSRDHVTQEVRDVMTAGGNTAVVGTAGIVDGIAQACQNMSMEEQRRFKAMLKASLHL